MKYCLGLCFFSDFVLPSTRYFVRNRVCRYSSSTPIRCRKSQYKSCGRKASDASCTVAVVVPVILLLWSEKGWAKTDDEAFAAGPSRALPDALSRGGRLGAPQHIIHHTSTSGVNKKPTRKTRTHPAKTMRGAACRDFGITKGDADQKRRKSQVPQPLGCFEESTA